MAGHVGTGQSTYSMCGMEKQNVCGACWNIGATVARLSGRSYISCCVFMWRGRALSCMFLLQIQQVTCCFMNSAYDGASPPYSRLYTGEHNRWLGISARPMRVFVSWSRSCGGPRVEIGRQWYPSIVVHGV
jgi:hypothetical protein